MTLRNELRSAVSIIVGSPRDATTSPATPVLRLDDRGHRMAARHIEQGKRGAETMTMPPGLAPWHAAALALREARDRRSASVKSSPHPRESM